MSKYSYKDILVKTYDYCPYLSKYRAEEDYYSQFYIDHAIKSGGRVLEFGFATGLLTLSLAKAGINLDSVDISEEMLEITRDKLSQLDAAAQNRAKLILGNMLEFVCDTKYDMIAMADSLLLALTSFEGQLELFKKANTLLRADGLLVFDIFPPNLRAIGLGTQHDFSRFKMPDGTKYIVKREEVIEPSKQFHYVNLEFDELDVDAQVIASTTAHIKYRYIYQYELELMLRANGFETVSINHQFDEKIKNQAWVAKKTEEKA